MNTLQNLAVSFIILVLLSIAKTGYSLDDVATNRTTGNLTIEHLFELRYNEWKEYCIANPRLSYRAGGPKFKAIIDLGPQAVPFIMKRLCNSTESIDSSLVGAAILIVKKGYMNSDLPEGYIRSTNTFRELYVKWWKEDRINTKQEFDKLYSSWKVEKEKAETISGHPILWQNSSVLDSGNYEIRVIERDDAHLTKLGIVYVKIRNMGIDILPYIIQKINEKDYDLLSIFGELTSGNGILPPVELIDGKEINHKLDERVKYSLDWWNKNKNEWTIPIQ